MSNISHIELGCGLDAARVKEWLSQGITSCIGIDLSLSEKNESFEVLQQAQKYAVIEDFFTLDETIKKYLKELDALEFLKTIPSHSVQVITADFFFNVLPFFQSIRIMRQCKRVLQRNGELLVTSYEHDKITPLLLWALGFRTQSTSFKNPELTNFMKLSRMYEDERIKTIHARISTSHH